MYATRVRTTAATALAVVVAVVFVTPAWAGPGDGWVDDDPVEDDGSELIGNIESEMDVLNNGRSGSGGEPAPTCTWEDEDGEEQEGHLRWRLTATEQENWDGFFDVDSGAVYRYECWSDDMECGDPIWDGDDGCYGIMDSDTWCDSAICLFESINPPNLAQYAVDGFVETLAPPEPQFSPPGGRTYVNFDTWMWVDNIPDGGVINPPAMSVPGMTVTTTATLDSVTWDMGDGGGPVNCPLTTTEADAEAECTYSYPRSSANQPDNAYHGSASLTWLAEWEVEEFGVSGEVEAPRTSEFTLEVAEVQSIVTRGDS